MKPEERVAGQFLTKRFGKEPTYEPLGKNRPPDFSIGGTAFEVRRLNQQFSGRDGKSEGLEEQFFPLVEAVSAELGNIPLSPQVGSFFFRLSFKRPLRSAPGGIARELARQARAHYLRGDKKYTICVDNVEVEIFPGISSDKTFELGICKDYDSDGWTKAIHLKALQLALDEKAVKTKPAIQDFSEWVLVLVNTIPGTNWLRDVGPLSLNLHHFRGIAVLSPKGSLTLEWPNNSLPVGL